MPPRSTWAHLVKAALAEDLGPGDVTSLALLSSEDRGLALIELRQPAVIAGLEVAREVFARCDVDCRLRASDGADLGPGERLAEIEGPARGILAAERVALNFLQRLSGIASSTRRFCDAVKGTEARILDTRKTTPGWRTLEKFAVRCGGGENHRTGLFDGILIKDNHIAAVGDLREAVRRAVDRAPDGLRIQVEIESVSQAREALAAGAEALLVDNQPPPVIAEVVAIARGRASVEATGGITLENITEVARTGVDRISIGALTHSALAVDIALEWDGRSPS